MEAVLSLQAPPFARRLCGRRLWAQLSPGGVQAAPQSWVARPGANPHHPLTSPPTSAQTPMTNSHLEAAPAAVPVPMALQRGALHGQGRLQELSAQSRCRSKPCVSCSALTSLPEVRLNSTKMCPTTSHAQQLWEPEPSSSLMNSRTALRTCQGRAWLRSACSRPNGKLPWLGGSLCGSRRDAERTAEAFAPGIRAGI